MLFCIGPGAQGTTWIAIMKYLFFQRDDGGYGFKRFVRDGHHTVREDPSKRFYDIAELTVRGEKAS